MLLRNAFLALCFLGLGCGGVLQDPEFLPCGEGFPIWEHMPLAVQYESRMNARVVDELLLAEDWWNEQVGQVFIDFGPTDVFVPFVGHVHVKETAEGGKATAYLRYSDDCAIEKVAIDMPGNAADWFLWIAARHELGHALGLGHDDDDKGSIMSPMAHFGISVELREDDMRALQGLYGLQ